MSSSPYSDTDDRQSSSDMSTVDLSSRSSSLYLDYPQQNQSAQYEQQQIRNHHKLRTSPKCSPLRPSEDNYNRVGSHGSQISAHQRRFNLSSIDSRSQHQTSSPTASAEPPSFITINPGSRMYTYIFLLFVAFAIVHAVFQGFENMHDARQSQYNNYQSDSSKDSLRINDEDEVPTLNNRMKYDNRSTNENREGGAVAATASASSVSAEPSATVLSRTSQLSYLISNLGAGDVVECYVVTRMAQLTNVVSTVPLGNAANAGNRNLDGEDAESAKESQETIAAASTTSSAQPTGPILIRKSGLAFRYRPRVASAPNSPDTPDAPKYFEITLEYGPQRTGSTKSFESLPMLHVDTETDAGSNKYVSWENEGRVYHSTHISNDWTEAYYMAPITGVVLEKILQRAVDYPRKRPRYQPFEVVSVPSGNLIVRSSGSDDFVWEMFRDLADLYVEIDPILVPNRGKVQFYVADAAPTQKVVADEESQSTAKRKEPNPNVQRVKGGLEAGRAAAFYEKFYNCANAIKTGDYSMYLPPATPEPTSAPTEIVSAFPSMSPSGQATSHSSVASSELVDEPSGVEAEDTDANLTLADTGAPEVPTGQNVTSAGQYTNDQNNEVDSEDDGALEASNPDIQDQNNTEVVTNNKGSVRTRFLRSMEDKDEDESEVLDESLENTNYNSTLDDLPAVDGNSTSDADEEDVAEAAEKLQQAAVEAAENAANVASKNSSAADSAAAASQAAEAAKKAKDATIAARNKVASEGIISGDGALATSILSSCFSDPKYGIVQTDTNVKPSSATNTNGESYDEEAIGNDERDISEEPVEARESVHAYIYLDGDTFFRLKLTAPYWGTASSFQTVPQPSLKPEGWGDSVDWAIFMFILVASLFGFLVMFHQGACFIIDKRLQFAYFFRPTEHDKVDSADLQAEQDALRRGGGFAHSIGIDAIPTSMGGKLSHYSDNIESQSSSSTGGSTAMLLEMTHQRSASNGLALGRRDSLPSSLRIRRDAPDQVERPTLMTTSKPAMPQQSPRDDDNDSSKADGDFRQGFTEALTANIDDTKLVPPFI